MPDVGGAPGAPGIQRGLTSIGADTGMRVAAYLHNAGFAGNDLITAVAIAYAESGLHYDAKGGPNSDGSYDYGLMQINGKAHPDLMTPTVISDGTWKDPLWNARAAFKIYSAAGHKFTPWSTYSSGSYDKHMGDAKSAVKRLQDAGPQAERDILATEGADSGQTALKDKIQEGAGALSNPITSAMNAVADQLNKIGQNIALVAIAITFIVLGVVILLRKQVINASPVGRVASAAKSVGSGKAGVVAKTVETVAPTGVE